MGMADLQTTGRRITGRHVLYGILGFFGVVFAANGAFVFLALESFTGLATDSPYQRGIEYNQTLAAAAEQRALGWRGAIDFTATGESGGRLQMTLRDRHGAPIEDLQVSGQVRRPTSEGFDQDVTLARRGPGLYAVDLALPLHGQWDVSLTAESRSGKRFRLDQRIWLK
jgi:nitrogen fixation protein FixH